MKSAVSIKKRQQLKGRSSAPPHHESRSSDKIFLFLIGTAINRSPVRKFRDLILRRAERDSGSRSRHETPDPYVLADTKE